MTPLAPDFGHNMRMRIDSLHGEWWQISSSDEDFNYPSFSLKDPPLRWTERSLSAAAALMHADQVNAEFMLDAMFSAL